MVRKMTDDQKRRLLEIGYRLEGIAHWDSDQAREAITASDPRRLDRARTRGGWVSADARNSARLAKVQELGLKRGMKIEVLDYKGKVVRSIIKKIEDGHIFLKDVRGKISPWRVLKVITPVSAKAS